MTGGDEGRDCSEGDDAFIEETASELPGIVVGLDGVAGVLNNGRAGGGCEGTVVMGATGLFMPVIESAPSGGGHGRGNPADASDVEATVMREEVDPAWTLLSKSITSVSGGNTFLALGRFRLRSSFVFSPFSLLRLDGRAP
jgi:hypothetical protein